MDVQIQGFALHLSPIAPVAGPAPITSPIRAPTVVAPIALHPYPFGPSQQPDPAPVTAMLLGEPVATIDTLAGVSRSDEGLDKRLRTL